jgi:lysophospholipase L1-like esterase
LRRRFETWGRLALAGGSIFFTAVLLEAGLRLGRWVPERHRAPAHVYSTRRTVMLDCYPENPRGYFDVDLLRPDVRARYEQEGVARLSAVAAHARWGVEVRYNAQRFRDAPLGPKPAGVTRVMVLGDSFTEGQGVREADTCVRRVERLLNGAGGRRYEVRNCGRRATDFPELYRNFDALLAWEPDVVVHAMVLNDGERGPSFEAGQDFLNDWIVDQARWEGARAPSFGFYDSRLLAFAREGARRWRVGRASTRWYRDMYGPANEQGWAHTQAYLRGMNERMRARGGRFVVMLWPLLVGLDRGYPFEELHATLARFSARAGIPFTDLLPVLRGRRPADLWVYPVDMHPNEEANRLAAESLAPVLRALVEARP